MPDVGGIFVGGQGTRMGGIAKGLLTVAGGETLIARWRSLFEAIGWPTVLVGRHEAYADMNIECIDDRPAGIGPLGGLAALLGRAGAGRAIAVACDMPFVSVELLRRLAAHASPAPVVAARTGSFWEPLFARYDAPRVITLVEQRIRSGEHGLQRLLDAAGADSLPLAAGEVAALRDWDRPEDRLI